MIDRAEGVSARSPALPGRGPALPGASTMIVRSGPTLSPVDATARLWGRPGRFLLHSASNADGCGRWSFVSCDPQRVLRSRAKMANDEDPFARLVDFADLPPLDAQEKPWPVAVGFFAYDLARVVEKIPTLAADDLEHPDLWLSRYGAVWRHDRVSGECDIVGDDQECVDRLHAALGEPVSHNARAPAFGALHAERSANDYRASVARILEYIQAGAVYQVNLARRLRAPVQNPGSLEPLALYKRLTEAAPAPFAAFLECDELAILCNSPELYLRRLPGVNEVETRPIKGTCARAQDSAEDAQRARELGVDEKERAEHLMIVDLERNDLGRVAKAGSVRVSNFCRHLQLPTVHHLVSTVSAELQEGQGLSELLRACFPGGSITGAPKVRAMEIIEELEPVRRGVYTGAIGYLGAGDAIDLCITIRTAVLTRDALYLHVGGGIVADSTPERELEETEEKAAAWRRALE